MKPANAKWMVGVFAFSLLVTPAMAQTGGEKSSWDKRQAGEAAFVQDRELFHFLLEHRGEIRREVTVTKNGVETLTESDNPDVASAIQKHVASMESRVTEKRPIHLRDPLFVEVFRHAEKIAFDYEKTEKGVRVQETSENPYVAKLIQAHAAVVSLFIKHGFAEVHRNHEPPQK